MKLARPGEDTLVDLLLRCATGPRARRPVIVFRRRDGSTQTRTGEDVLERARCVAGMLRVRDVVPGDRVLIMSSTHEDFIDAFFGASWAGAVPVPAAPPMFLGADGVTAAALAAVAASARPRALVVSGDLLTSAAALRSRMPGDPAILSPAWADGGGEPEGTPAARDAADLALVQYTSGSTGTPRGVALAHGNVLANIRAIGHALRLGMADTGVSWLPMYHDMGLIGVLATLFHQGRVVLMPTLDFARDPASWLRAISEHGGTLSAAPNFAYQRCLTLDERRTRDLDLSSWRAALNGAESVAAGTLRGFASRFARCGFKPSALRPVYGLAEHTLAVSIPTLEEAPRIDSVDRRRLAQTGTASTLSAGHPDAMAIVGVGAPVEGVEVCIRDRHGHALPEGRVGEITVRSASVMTGYFGDRAATLRVLADGWLATGDLGYLKAGWLYVTGRRKELVIRAGRNYYPQDIESAAGEVAGVQAGRIVAFSAPCRTGVERVVVVAEANVRGPVRGRALACEVGTAVASRVGFRPERVVLCRPRTLPVTSSGKLRRGEARARFLAGTLDLLPADEPDVALDGSPRNIRGHERASSSTLTRAGSA